MNAELVKVSLLLNLGDAPVDHGDVLIGHRNLIASTARTVMVLLCLRREIVDAIDLAFLSRCFKK